LSSVELCAPKPNQDGLNLHFVPKYKRQLLRVVSPECFKDWYLVVVGTKDWIISSGKTPPVNCLRTILRIVGTANAA